MLRGSSRAELILATLDMPNGFWTLNEERHVFKPPHYHLQACTKNLLNMGGIDVCKTTNSQRKSHCVLKRITLMT